MKKDNTFVAIGILITIAVPIIALFSLLFDDLSVSDIALCIFAVIALDALCCFAHKTVNHK